MAARSGAYALYIFPGLRKVREDQLEASAAGNLSAEGTFTSGQMERAVDRHLIEFDEAAHPISTEKTCVFW